VALASSLVVGASAPAHGAGEGPRRSSGVVLVSVDAAATEIRSRIEASGGDLLSFSPTLGIAVVRVREQDEVRLADVFPDAAIASDHVVRASWASPDDPRFPRQWGLEGPGDQDVDARRGWGLAYGGDGSTVDGSRRIAFPQEPTGATIGIIDSGVDIDHPDLFGGLGERLVGCARATGGTGVVTAGGCDDDSGHGTHVTGIAAAVTDNGVGVSGVAPSARIASCKALDASGQGFVSDVIGCMDWLDGIGVDVISMSLGGSYDEVWERAAAEVWDRGRGVLMVASSGNSGDERPSYPAAFGSVVSVASTERTGERSFFSNFNDDVELSAPGARIVSTIDGGGYAVLSGTSMAVPVVAGVAAMIVEQDPTSKSSRLRKLLRKSVDDLGTRGRDAEFGFGRINLAKAMAALV
jgi:subtilisin family serine protease